MEISPTLLIRTLTPKTQLGYNVGGDLIQIKKTFIGITWTRVITDPDVADNVVNKWVVYGEWSVG